MQLDRGVARGLGVDPWIRERTSTAALGSWPAS